MKILYVGPAAEGRGFALAGAAVEVCDSAARAAAALAAARNAESAIGLVLLSSSLADRVREELKACGVSGPPAVLAVPGGRP